MSSKMNVGELEPTHVSSTVRWKIQNFRTMNAPPGMPIHSPAFDITHPNLKKLQWRLRLCLGKEKSKEYVGLFLRYLGDCPVSVSYSFSIVNADNDKVSDFSHKESLFKTNQSLGTSKFCLKSDILNGDKVLTNDALVISCTITVNGTSLDDELYDAEDCARVYYENLLESGVMSDVTFEIEKKQMRLHKTIVASLSPVFLAMFQHQMKEKEEGIVKITDVKYEVMKELFRYIYVRKVNGIKHNAADLLVAANKYDVQGLKVLCENILSQSLNVGNALQRLEFAMVYNTSLLKGKVIEFIVSRLEEFVDRPEFELMDGIYKGELLRAMAKKNSNK